MQLLLSQPNNMSVMDGSGSALLQVPACLCVSQSLRTRHLQEEDESIFIKFLLLFRGRKLLRDVVVRASPNHWHFDAKPPSPPSTYIDE